MATDQKDKINHKVLVNNIKNEVAKNFVAESLNHFNSELQLYCNSFQDDPFQYNEAATIGLFLSGILHNDSRGRYSAIQEFCVYDENEKHKGRADLLIYDNEKKCNFLFESKHNYVTNENKDINWDDKTIPYLTEIINQAKQYFEAERKCYKNDTYLIALAFDSVKIKIGLTEYLDYEDKIKNDDYFSSIYYSKELYERGCQNYNILSVYGFVEKS